MLELDKIKWLRLYKSGLIKQFKNAQEVLSKFDIQAQSFNDAAFNLSIRTLSQKIIEIIEMINKTDILRIWTVRNTLHLILPDNFKKTVKINNLIGNWYERNYLKTEDDIMSYKAAVQVFKNNYIVTKEMLINASVNLSHINRWQGIFIQLTKDGLLASKLRDIFFSTREYALNNCNNEELIRSLISDYLLSYGPATLNDFCHWSGISITKAKEQLKGLDYIHFNSRFILSRKDKELIRKNNDFKFPDCIILGKFDPILLAYSDKSWICEEPYFKYVWGKAGLVEAVVLKNGTITGTWRKKDNYIYLKLFNKVSKNFVELMEKKFTDFFGDETKIKEMKYYEKSL